MTSRAIGILGMGRALGARVQTNEELCATTLPGTTPEWIVEKTPSVSVTGARQAAAARKSSESSL